MKKVFIVFMCALLLVGCGGNKSQSDLTDIEQFKCQDSIETVFSVLGDAEMKTSASGGKYFEYEELNLWGYNGNAVFLVRDDGDTIQNFYCHLALNQKEFEDIVSRFSDKYGSYEVTEFGSTIKTYEWSVLEDNFGYDNIAIQCNGDNDYTITFSDDFSYISDEEYFSQNETLTLESTQEAIKSKSYDLGDGDTITLSMFDDGGLNLNISAKISNEEKASIAYVYLFAIVFDDNFGNYVNSYTIISDSGMVLFTENGIMGTNGDEAISGEPSWLILDTEKWDMSDEEQRNLYDTLWNSCSDFMTDF